MKTKIDLPESFIFTTHLEVRASDINYGGHLGNDSVLTLLQEARIHFFRANGFKDEATIDGTVGQIIAEFAVLYKAESFMGDQLTIHIGVSDIHKYGFDMIYQVLNRKTEKEIARARSANLCFDYAKRKIATIPEVLKTKLQS
jgi:acyl-CoA thioester hydrolase